MSEQGARHAPGAWLRTLLGDVCGAVWILGGTLFFVMRFSSVFYEANRSAIDGALERLLGWHP